MIELLKKIIPENFKKMLIKVLLSKKKEFILTSHQRKQEIILEYKYKYGCDILIETGTYLGDMVFAQLNKFKKIYSIELGVELFEKAKERFKDNHDVSILQGDSGNVLPELIEEINEPIIFWLDGHYSSGITALGEKECPIYEELKSILLSSHKYNHVILVDDARCFIGKNDYPTIKELYTYVTQENERYNISVQEDIIRLTIR